MSRFEEKVNWKNGNVLVLPATQVLLDLPESLILYNTEYGVRPPIGVYNTSVNTVVLCALRVLDILLDENAIREETEESKSTGSQLLEAYDAFLDSLMEHTDDCLRILRSFFPTTEKWTKQTAVKEYKKAIEDYRDYIGLIVNHIKHNQGRLRYAAIYNDSVVVPGYFVEGVEKDGSVGPCLEIHKGKHSAFSFNRDVRLHIVGLMQISKALSIAAQSLGGIVQAESYNIERPGKERLSELFDKVYCLPKQVFPQELKLDWPEISYRPADQKNNGFLKVTYPGYSQRPTILKGKVSIVSKFQGDGVTKKFRYPM